MKKIPIILAFIFSLSCSYILLSSTKKEDIEEYQSNAVGIEIGVFNDLKYAKSMQKRLGGYIIKDNDLYRIYYGILKSDKNITYVNDYLKSSNISFYNKKLLLKQEQLDELSKLEKILDKEENENKKIKLMQIFIENYEEVI